MASERCSYCITYAVVFRVDIEEAGLFDAVAGGILGKAGDVDNAKTRCVVGLVGETVKSL
jgi:hypothetical protein